MFDSSAYENAVKKASTRTNNRPGTISKAVVAPPFCWTTCAWNVVHRNAPGAIRAIALIVSPVIVRVRFISVPGAAAISVLLLAHGSSPDRHLAGGFCA
jgi:hypothetical protein